MLHDGEVTVDEAVVHDLLQAQRPEWVDLALSLAGSGTDNTMYRLGDELIVRLPRTPGNARALRKEQQWLPRLAPHLPCSVPEPVYAGTATATFPLVWSVYRWIDGAEADGDTVGDWATFGADLAAVVRAFHSADLMGAARTDDDLSWYRGGTLQPCDRWVTQCLDDCRNTAGLELDVDSLEELWRAALRLPEPTGPPGWLHGDLKPTNLLARAGRLHAVIDFGSLSVGHPDAEHATVWDLPRPARHAYWDALQLDELTWLRARAWAVAVAVSGISHYWDTYPAFVHECDARLRAVLDH